MSGQSFANIVVCITSPGRKARVIIIITLLPYFECRIMIESPEWLAAYKRYDEAETSLMKMAAWNGVRKPQFVLKRESDTLLDGMGNVTEKVKDEDIAMTVPVGDLFTDPKLRLHLAVSSILM